jgi:hypothetical protein
LFPFGHGLGYAQTQGELTSGDVVDGTVRLHLRATNRGDRPTVHVAQTYVELEGFEDGRALVDVTRVPLPPGGVAEAEIVIGAHAFARFDPQLGRRAVVDGVHRLRCAVDAVDDGDVATVEVVGGPHAVRLEPS